MNAGELYDTIADLVKSRPARQATEVVGQGSTPTQVIASIDESRSRDLRGYVYAIKNPTSGAIKIGFATNPRGRFSSLGVAHSERLELLGVMRGDRELEFAI